MAPTIPPRPVRSQKTEASTSAAMDIPQVPPRPNRHVDRAISPDRDSFARSPLNETTFAINKASTQQRPAPPSESSSTHSQRPPSVTLPSIGQEGNEYANIEDSAGDSDAPVQPGTSETQLRNVSEGLQLHAPKPSLPSSSAKARVANVTKTDSTQAPVPTFSRQLSDDHDPSSRSLKAKSSSLSQRSNASTDRPDSAHLAEGDFGQKVPMYPNAGDVQAPSPAPGSSNFGVESGYSTDGSLRSGRHHGRKKSAKEHFQPPGSYGLHGHGIAHNDRFEKAWYEKHPEARVREQGEYGPGIGNTRPEWALSSDDLNKIVRETASRGSGFGASPGVLGTPSEQIGYQASEEYALRIASATSSTTASAATSPRPASSSYMNKGFPGIGQGYAESPLKRSSFGSDLTPGEQFPKASKPISPNAAGSETEDDTVRIDPPSRKVDKYGGGGYDPPTRDLGPHGGNSAEEGGWIDEQGYGVPILASDEVAKEPLGEFMQPAVEPPRERRGSSYMIGQDEGNLPGGSHGSSLAGSLPASRPTSRPASVHGLVPPLSRFASQDDHEDRHTQLEDVEEYEPLFPEDEAKGKLEQQKLETAAHRLRRPDLMLHKFPSKDIWEDAPNSAQLMATVSTPELEEDARTVTAEDEPEQKATDLEEFEEEPDSFLAEEQKRKALKKFNPHLRQEMDRPSIAHRFPSRDIWEDTPASAHLEATVGDPQTEEMKAIQNPDRPTTSVVAGTALAAAGGLAAGEDRATTSLPTTTDKSIQPSVPARPVKKLSSDSQRKGPAPSIPDRPKPQIPARPAKVGSRDSSEQVPLSKTISGASARSIGSQDEGGSIPKAKPAVPSKPNGGKIASLKGGFMSDLEQRLQLGPQAPAKPQAKAVDESTKEEDAAPLSDTRKGRARGPPRRKPAGASPSPSGIEDVKTDAKPVRGLSAASTVWQIADDGELVLGTGSTGGAAGSGSGQPRKATINEPSGIAIGLAAEAAAKKADAEAEPEAGSAVATSTGKETSAEVLEKSGPESKKGGVDTEVEAETEVAK